MPRSDREAVAAKVAAAQEVLAGEVARLVSGEDWQRFLALQARLHGYSFGNLLLIAAAHGQAFRDGRVPDPEPSMVAGFRTWQALGRSVQRGQRGYPILAPCRLRRRESPGDPEVEGSTAAGADRPEERPVVGFRMVHVFDVSQTAGADLPLSPAPSLLAGAAPAGLIERVRRLVESEGFTVGAVPDAGAIGGANGVTDWSTMRVLVRADMDQAARAKTLLHESGHVFLHGDEPGRSLPRTVKEVEAESVAFVAGRLCGLATDSYSFPYVAAWAGNNPGRALSATASRVAAAADRIASAFMPAPPPCATVTPAGVSLSALTEPGLEVGW